MPTCLLSSLAAALQPSIQKLLICESGHSVYFYRVTMLLGVLLSWTVGQEKSRLYIDDRAASLVAPAMNGPSTQKPLTCESGHSIYFYCVTMLLGVLRSWTVAQEKSHLSINHPAASLVATAMNGAGKRYYLENVNRFCHVLLSSGSSTPTMHS